MDPRAGVEAILSAARNSAELIEISRDESVVESYSAMAEAYQLAGWMSFDDGRDAQADNLFVIARSWADRAGSPELTAFILGPNWSFVSTYTGDPVMGVERAHGALGWARRSGNRRLTAFALAIAARAHSRLRKSAVALALLDEARVELSAHDPGSPDPDWLAVFDEAALDGHLGSCLLDLGHAEKALGPLLREDSNAPTGFVRNRVIWRLDRATAWLSLNEVDEASAEVHRVIDLVSQDRVTQRVLQRFRVLALLIDARQPSMTAGESQERLRDFIAVSA